MYYKLVVFTYVDAFSNTLFFTFSILRNVIEMHKHIIHIHTYKVREIIQRIPRHTSCTLRYLQWV